MSEPEIADKKPVQTDLESGKEYWFCACGKSEGQPFCDGSHKGTGITPMAFTAEETGPAWLCQCKRSGNLPYCDGTHKSV